MSAAACEHLREIAPEVALGIADGEDRAWALEHLDGCPACRARIERLSTLADELLLLAPAAEPPAGFEGRVGEAIAAPAPAAASFFRRRFVIPAAAALAAAACAAGAVWFALSRRPQPRRLLPGDARGRQRRVTSTPRRWCCRAARRSAMSTATRAAPRGCSRSSTTAFPTPTTSSRS